MSLLTIVRRWTAAADEWRALRTDGDGAEAAAGERLAELMVAVLAPPRAQVVVLRCRCGGIAWEPDPSGMCERCAACGAWSRCSAGIVEVP